MKTSGGFCITRYDRGGGGGMYGMSKVDRIMLKYRPIAPKPVAAGSCSGGSTTENSDGYVKCRRSKRKYVRAKGNKNKKDDFKRSTAAASSPVVTLSLLPETPDRKENSDLTLSTKCNCNYSMKSAELRPMWLSFNNQEQKGSYGDVIDPVVLKPQVVSYVTVECVTDTWLEGEGIGCTDVERVINIDMDTCPGFISDGQDRVVWTNKAYRQMAGGGEDMVVVLARKDIWTTTAATVTYPAFTCKVRVTSGTPSHRKMTSLTVPCDVWRMERGACAWRLDVKAALSLGR